MLNTVGTKPPCYTQSAQGRRANHSRREAAVPDTVGAKPPCQTQSAESRRSRDSRGEAAVPSTVGAKPPCQTQSAQSRRSRDSRGEAAVPSTVGESRRVDLVGLSVCLSVCLSLWSQSHTTQVFFPWQPIHLDLRLWTYRCRWASQIHMMILLNKLKY